MLFRSSPRIYPNAVDEINPDLPRLLSVFPNPVKESVSFEIIIPEINNPVTLGIYDTSGNLKDTILNERLTEGYHQVRWTTGNLASGVYLCILKSGSFSVTRKFVLVH